MVAGKKLTVCCHVDNLNILCVHKKDVSKLIKWLKYRYGEMHGSRGTIHDYIVMWLDYSVKREVRIYMED